MKKLTTLSLALTLSAFAFGDTTSRTKTTTIEERSTNTAINSEFGSDAEMLEAEENDPTLDEDELSEERMEERDRNRDFIKPGEEIDYQDRTRTNRERKAINTGSHASDDK